MHCQNCGRANRADAIFCDACGTQLARRAELHPGHTDLTAAKSFDNELFIGRQPEMGVLHAALEDALAGRGRLVMLVGEPGIGKTRTAKELTVHAGQRGALVLWGRCHESSGAPPYWPWVQILRSYIRDQDIEYLQDEMGPGASDIATIVPEVRGQLPDVTLVPHFEDPEQARFRLFDSITLFLKRASQPHPLVLVLDNLHWADKPSLLLLEFLGAALDDCRLLVLGTYRDVEVSRQHPLSETLGELTRERPLQRVLLRGLNRQEVNRFIAVATGFTPLTALVEAIYAQTEGNPLFLTEMVRFLVQEGAFDPQRFLDSSQSMGLPEGIRDVIGKRLNRLSESCNQLLTMAAVIGREFDLQEVSTLHGAGAKEHVLTLLEEAITARVIEEIPQTRGQFQFAHALIRATLYDELTLTRRVQLHRRIGEALETLYSPHLESHLAQLAYHFGEATEGEMLVKAMDYAVQAGERANGMLAYEEAARYFTMALQAYERQDSVDEARHATLLLALGEAQRKAGDVSRALEAFQRAADLARQVGSAESLAHAALGFEETSWRPGLPGDAAARLLEDALTMLGEADTPMKARVLGSLGRARAFTGAFEEAMAIEQQAIETARRIGDPATLAATLKARFYLRFWPQHLASRLASAIELIKLGEDTDDRETVLLAYAWRLFDLMELGDMPEVDRQLVAHTRLAEELRQPFYLYVNATFQAMRAIFAGQFAEGEQLAHHALTIGQRLRGQDALGVYGVQMFTLRREQGRLQEVAPVVRHFVQTSPQASAWRPGLALIYSELGLEQEARDVFEQLAADDFAHIPHDARWVTCMTYLAEVCVFLGDTRRAATLYQCLLPHNDYNILIGPTAACYGAASRYLGMLAAAMFRWEEAQDHFEAALAMNARMRAKPWLAHTQHEYAKMLLARNQSADRQHALTLLGEALRISRALSMQALEQRVVALQEHARSQAHTAQTYPCGLSQREAEVLRLIAAGKSNREIADTLFISPNTVANHVRNILTKTNSVNRTEAAAFAIHHELIEVH